MNYNDKRWIKVSTLTRLERGECEKCHSQLNLEVHHRKPVFEDSPIDMWFDPDNLVVLCHYCHGTHHTRFNHKDKTGEKAVTNKQFSVDDLEEVFGNRQVAYSVWKYLEQYYGSYTK